jgi:hypothetical protein
MKNHHYKKVSKPDGTLIATCPVCGGAGALWRYSLTPDAPTVTAVMCDNGTKFGPQDGLLEEGCLLYMPPDGFYRGTIREAVKYWNDYAQALVARRVRTGSGHDLRSEAGLTRFKTDSVIARGYHIVGYVLVNEAGSDFCLSAQGAVRWLAQPHYWRLMHEQDGSLFGTGEQVTPK